MCCVRGTRKLARLHEPVHRRESRRALFVHPFATSKRLQLSAMVLVPLCSHPKPLMEPRQREPASRRSKPIPSFLANSSTVCQRVRGLQNKRIQKSVFVREIDSPGIVWMRPDNLWGKTKLGGILQVYERRWPFKALTANHLPCRQRTLGIPPHSEENNSG